MAQDFHDLKVWQKAIELTTCIYKLTRAFPKDEMYGLSSQMRRASVSVASNIAEGRGRLSPAEFRQFLGLSQARFSNSRRNCSFQGTLEWRVALLWMMLNV
jgi:four helix bundle protein